MTSPRLFLSALALSLVCACIADTTDPTPEVETQVEELRCSTCRPGGGGDWDEVDHECIACRSACARARPEKPGCLDDCGECVVHHRNQPSDDDNSPFDGNAPSPKDN